MYRLRHLPARVHPESRGGTTQSSTRNYAAWVATALVVATLAGVLILISAFVNAPAASAKSSDHGASFAVRCDFSHRAPDDPIVYPRQPGEAHSHDFFGNTTTDAFSTYNDGTEHDLLGKPTTCTRFEEDTAAYWMPTVSWNGAELESDRAVFYYRAGGKNHKNVRAFPGGLKIIAGGERRVKWRCEQSANGGESPTPPSRCDGDSPKLGVRIIFPDCVAVARNGQSRLDSKDHRSHMAYSRSIGGEVRCPRLFPRSVPALTMNVTFPLPTPRGEVTLSSGAASSMHTDFFNAWNQEALVRLVTRCINQVPPSAPRPEECQSPKLQG
jgi:hypothetical protein